MSRAIKTSQLSLKLDVILEEDFIESVDNLCIADEALYQPQRSPYVTTCTVTLQNDRDLQNEPQFLHSGKWPTMDDMNNKQISPSKVLIEINSIKSSSSDSDTRTPPSPTNTTPWQPITADELSMTMDFWNPTTSAYPPFPTPQTHARTVTDLQQSLFHREITDEYRTRTQTVAHIEELEDNDSAIEIVATLEGYRQNGWANEMIATFPRQCWDFWVLSGLAGMKRVSDSYSHPNGVCDFDGGGDGNRNWFEAQKLHGCGELIY